MKTALILLLVPTVHNFMFNFGNSYYQQYSRPAYQQLQSQYLQQSYPQSQYALQSTQYYQPQPLPQAQQTVYAPPQGGYLRAPISYVQPQGYVKAPISYVQPPPQYVRPPPQYVRPPPQYVQPPQYVRPTPPPDPCFTNEHGFRCCNRNLLNLMNDVVNHPQKRRQFEACNQQKLANEVVFAAQNHFNMSFEAVVSRAEIANRGWYTGDMMCKTMAPDGKHILLYATPVPYTTDSKDSRPLTDDEIAVSPFAEMYHQLKELPTSLLYHRSG